MLLGIIEIISLLFLLSVTFVYFWLKHHYAFWKRLGIPEIKPHLIFGNLREMLLMQKSPPNHFKDLYNHPDAVNHPVVGIHVFHKAALFIREPELIKRILVKDFSKFSNRYATSDQYGDSLGSKNIFFIKNPAWKEIRSKLSPFFTSGKIRQMFPLIEEVGRQLDAHLCSLELNFGAQSLCLELKELCALYTTDVIATVAYGVKANSLRNPNSDFRRNGREVFKFTTKRAIEFITIFFLPRWVSFFGFKVLPSEPTHFLRTTINYVMQERKLTGRTRNDLIDILIEYEKSANSNRQSNQIALDNDVLVAQAALFFTAGFETSSATMSFSLYELAKRQDLQIRVREEIRQALEESGGHVTHKMINSMEYMHMVIQEVLRLYPPLPFLDRENTLDEGEMYSLEPFSHFKMTRGMPVYIPVFGIHRDPKYFPDPNSFDPERFSPDNKKKIIPFTYMPFGIGPHSCIGERLGLMQTKIGLVNILRNHYVTTCAKSHPTMKLNPKALIIQSEGGVYCNLVRDPLK